MMNIFALACVFLAISLLLETVKHVYVYTFLRIAAWLYLIAGLMFFIKMIIYVVSQE